VQKKILKILIFLLVLFPFIPEAGAARSLTISSDTNSLFGDEEMTIVASPSGFTSGESVYIKAAFYQDGSTNYFGYTKNESTWIKNGESTLSQKRVNISEWDQRAQVKSDFTDSGFKGEGDYLLKIGFYYVTSGGGLSSVNWSNSITVNLNEPDPTISPTSSQISPIISHSPPALRPLSSPASVRISPSLNPSKAGVQTIATQFATMRSSPAPTQLPEIEVLAARENNLSFAIISAGLIFIVLGIGLFIFSYLRSKNFL
jgi:hypothetical protein